MYRPGQATQAVEVDRVAGLISTGTHVGRLAAPAEHFRHEGETVQAAPLVEGRKDRRRVTDLYATAATQAPARNTTGYAQRPLQTVSTGLTDTRDRLCSSTLELANATTH